MRVVIPGFLVACCVLGMGGCGAKQEPQRQALNVNGNDKQQPDQQRANAPAAPEYTIRVTPAEFFSGELKRLEPHHDFGFTACYKVKTEGNVRIRPEVESWREGERIDIGKFLYEINDRSDEISLAVKRLPPGKDDKTWYRVSIGGIWTYARFLEEPTFREPPKVGFGPVSLLEPIELRPGSDSAVVWAMGDGHGLSLSDTNDKLDKQLKTLPWAMILRLSVEKKKH
jgi:hypothetical protein